MTASTFKRFAVPAALVVGGVTAGSFVAPLSLVSAQESDTDSTETESDTETDTETDADSSDAEDGHSHRRFGRAFGPKAEVLEETLGLSAEEIRDAMAEGSTLAEVAEAQGVGEDALTTALVEAATERIDQAVADGDLDAEEAEERKAGLEERIGEMINREPGENFGERGRRGHRGAGVLRGGLDAVEETLGLTAEEIQAGLAEGKTLADLAADQGISVDDLADALVAQATERLDAAVADGTIDEDRAASAAEQLEERIDQMIEAEPFSLGRGVGRAENRGLRQHHRNHHNGDDGAADEGEIVESSLTDV